jgi:hypothetical protein
MFSIYNKENNSFNFEKWTILDNLGFKILKN